MNHAGSTVATIPGYFTSSNVTDFSFGAIDTRGSGHLQIIGAINSSAELTTPSFLEESDDTLSWSTIPGYNGGTDWSFTTQAASAANPRVVLNVPLSGRKRYIRGTLTMSSASRGVVVAILGDKADAPESFSYPVVG